MFYHLLFVVRRESKLPNQPMAMTIYLQLSQFKITKNSIKPNMFRQVLKSIQNELVYASSSMAQFI
jgi:hypothetical protein